MSYKTEIYKNSLKAIERIYNKSKDDPDTDLYRSFDIINSVNDNQFTSKEWLVEALVPLLPKIKDLEHIVILGSWYGLLGVMLRQHLPNTVKITNVDSDPISKVIGKSLYNCEYNEFIVDDAMDHMINSGTRYQLIINTSCEHMEQDDVMLLRYMKRPKAILCFQSNNYTEIDSHINTSNTLDEFVENLKLIDVWHSSSVRSASDTYDRYTVIGQ